MLASPYKDRVLGLRKHIAINDRVRRVKGTSGNMRRIVRCVVPLVGPRELEVPSRHANEPIELPARLDAVKEALQKALESRRGFQT